MSHAEEQAASTCSAVINHSVAKLSKARRAEVMEQIRLMPPQAEVVGIGDSLIAGWPPDLFTLPAKYKSYWNFGHPGDTTGDVLWRLAQAPLERIMPEKVFILIGTNDLNLGQSVCDTVVGINAIIQLVQEKWPNSKIGLVSIPPRGINNSELLAERNAVNAKLKQLSDHGGRFDLIARPDARLTCADAEGRCRYYQADYLHFNRAGYSVMNQLVRPFLER